MLHSKKRVKVYWLTWILGENWVGTRNVLNLFLIPTISFQNVSMFASITEYGSEAMQWYRVKT